MDEKYICPNVEICRIYKFDVNKKADVIQKNIINIYSCEALEKFNHVEYRDTTDVVENSPTKCALIELLNNSRKL